MPRILKDLKINEVSSVDKGAGRGVKVLLMKRDDTNSGETQMTEQEFQALVAKSANDAAATAVAAVTKTFTEELAKRDNEIVLLKMSATHKAFYDGCDESTKKSFAAMTDAERDEHMKKNPFKKADDSVTVDDLAKRDTVVAKLQADNAALTKRLDAADLEKKQAEFVKKAEALGLTQDGDGEIMRKAYSGDADAQVQFEKRQGEVFAALKKQAETGEIFKEFGSTRAQAGTAYSALVAKGEEIRKADPNLSKEQAFTKAYTDPNNSELVAKYKVESAPRLQVVA